MSSHIIVNKREQRRDTVTQSKRFYKWDGPDGFANLSEHTVTRGVDFDCARESFVMSLYYQAKRRGLKVAVRRDPQNERTLTFQFHPKTDDQ
jgi:hypothetical protein